MRRDGRGALRPITLVMVTCLVACSHAWRRVDPAPPVAWEPRQQFQVWCDSCRRELPLEQVDSLRIGNRMLEPFGLAVIALASLAGLGLF